MSIPKNLIFTNKIEVTLSQLMYRIYNKYYDAFCISRWALWFWLLPTFYLINFMVKVWIQSRFAYIFGYFTIRKNVQIYFS